MADDPRMLGGTPGGRWLEKAILNAPGCQFAEESEGVPPKPARLLQGEGHQPMLAADRGRGVRIVGRGLVASWDRERYCTSTVLVRVGYESYD